MICCTACSSSSSACSRADVPDDLRFLLEDAGVDEVEASAETPLEARRPGVLFCGVVLLVVCFVDFGVRSVALATKFLLGRVAAIESGC